MSHLNLSKKIKWKRITIYFFLSFFILFTLPYFLQSERKFELDKSRVRPGNENFLKSFPLELHNKRLGLVINHTSVLPDGKHLVKSLLNKEVAVNAIFSPEHGFQGIKEGGIEVEDSRFESIKIYSLYGKIRKPTEEQMRDIDAFVYDIQDVGTRFYTYITTLKLIIEAAEDANIPVYILDRPNPVGGMIVEGYLLQPEYESFIGACPIPVRYGLTVGELALMMRGEGWVPRNADIHVIKMSNWKRNYFWKDTGLPWIPPSPNIPTRETAVIYPGTGLLGALRINQGVGTSYPFLQIGAPWMDAEAVVNAMDWERQYSVKLEPLLFTPHSVPGKVLHPSYENKVCRGIRVHIIKEEKFHSLRFSLEIIKILKEKYKDRIHLYSEGMNLMFGNDLLSKYINDKVSYHDLLENMRKDERLFLKKRKKYLMYD
mgnify:CR=1 FL=1